MRYQVLGSVTATVGGAAGERTVRLGGPKQRLVLALLLLHAGRTVSDDRLVDGIWEYDPPRGARHALQTYISELRKQLDDDIVRDGHGYRLAIEPDVVDAHRFEALLVAGQERLRDSATGAAALFREALELWHGNPYADLAEAPALRPEIQRLQQLRLAAIEDRLAAELEVGRGPDIATEAEALGREHPYRERLYGLHMLALYRSGRQADALRVYDRTRVLLVEELGIEPSPHLQELHRRILEQDELLLPRASAGAPWPEPAGSFPPTDFPVVHGLELRERIGSGDFGTVYRAYQAQPGREVAVKVIAPDHAGATSFVRDFEHRAQRVARLEHPNVVLLLDFWRDPRGAFLVSPWVRRGSVRDALRHGAWSLAAALAMLEQVGGALVAAHRQGVVHGDVKPSNILLDADGNALLTDFAMATHRRDATGVPQSACPAYVSPEERRGQPLTQESDVYGLGVLAIEALTGGPPPADRPASALVGTCLPAPLVEALTRAVAPTPGERHQRVEDLLRDVRQAAGVDVVRLAGPDESAHVVRNPYKGLRAFQEADGGDFFGRDAVIHRLVEAVGAHRLVAVVGPSGSGKSSVVRAGLVPMLRAGAIPGSHDWLITDMFPGATPFEELEAALLRIAVDRPEDVLGELLADERGILRMIKQMLPSDDSELVLVIDQFEELFSVTADPQTRRLLLDGLVAVATDPRGRARIVITLRADYFDRPLEHHAFGELLREALVPITVPSRDELALAVSRPAAAVGVEYEPGLVPEIVADVAEQPGGLPLLQHALTELFNRRDRRELTATAYRRTGGVLGALGRRAEEVYSSLPGEARDVARQVFLRLVAVDAEHEDSRRRVRRSELESLVPSPSAVDQVVRHFGAHRLLSFDRDPVTRAPTVEVAHEALLREWQRLRGWIDERREALLLQRRLASALADWEQADRAPDYLLGGARLQGVDRWSRETDLALTEDERSYLEASTAHAGRAQKRRRRRRAALLVGLATVACAAVLLAAVAAGERDRARREERVASARALAASSRNVVDEDHDLAVLLAVEAVDATRSAGEEPVREAVEALHSAVLAHRVAQSWETGGSSVGFAADGARLFTGGAPHNRPAVWDPVSGEVVHQLDPLGAEPYHAAVSPDGRLAAQTHLDGPTAVWDLTTGRLVASLAGSQAVQAAPSFSPDGTLLAVGNLAQPDNSVGQTISIWDVSDGTEWLRIDHAGDLKATAFSPDGSRLAAGDWQAAVVRLYDVETGELGATLGDPADSRGVASVAFSPSGDELATLVLSPLEVIVRDVVTNEVIRSHALGGGAQIGEVCYSGDGEVLAATAADQQIHVWDARTGAQRLRLPTSAQLTGLACGPDGATIAKAGPNGTVRLWDIGAARPSEVLSIATAAPWTATWSADGDGLLVTHHDGTVRRYDAATGELLVEEGGLLPWPPWWLQESPDGRYIGLNANPYGGTDPARAPLDVPLWARLVIHDAHTLQPIRELPVGGWPVGFSSDGRRFLAADVDVSRIVDVETGAVLAELRPPYHEGDMQAGGPGFIPGDDRVVLSVGGRKEAFVFDSSTGKLTATICKSGGNHRGAVSADGQMLALATEFSTVEIWDLPRALELAEGETACRAGAAPSDAARIARFEANAAIALSFSPDGERIATAGFDGTVGVWNTRTGERIVALAHDGVVGGAAFSADGRRLLVTFSDEKAGLHAVRVYTLDVEELVGIARRKVTRPLTADECEAYLNAVPCP